jgi:hypothetical protein
MSYTLFGLCGFLDIRFLFDFRLQHLRVFLAFLVVLFAPPMAFDDTDSAFIGSILAAVYCFCNPGNVNLCDVNLCVLSY